MNDKKNFTEKIRPLLHLWPAGVVLAVTAASLPVTAPVLQNLPEKLEAAAATLDPVEDVQAAEAETEEQAEGHYEDGLYTGSARGYGGDVSVQVTVENHQITSVEILDASGETSSFFNRAKKVIDSVLEKQTWEVDVISGATYSSNGILGAIQNAITGEAVTNEKPASTAGSTGKSSVSTVFQDPSSYKDGTYYGSAQGFGGTISVAVTIAGGKITSVTVTDHSGETPSYYNQAKVVTDRIVSAQSPNVDTVSGATYSSRGILNAAKQALTQASVNGSTEEEAQPDSESTDSGVTDPAETTDPVPSEKFLAGNYTDGEYEGTAEGFGGDITTRITIQNNQITGIEIVSAEDETPSFLEKAKGVITEMIQSQTTDVDVVSGATYSSNGIINATKTALTQAAVSESGSEAEGEEPDTETTDTEDSETTDTEDTETTDTEDTETTDTEDTETTDTEDSETTEEKTLDGNYTDGDYEGTAEGFGGDITTRITLLKNRITDIFVVSADEETPSYLEKAEGVITEMLEDQTTDVDVVSGATYSSQGIIDSVEAALEKAKVQDTETEESVYSPVLYLNGTFSAEAEVYPDEDEDFDAYPITVQVTFLDDKITEVSFTEDNTFGDVKTNKTFSTKAMTSLAEQTVTLQAADDLDAVSGATCSSKAIKEAILDALSQALIEQ